MALVYFDRVSEYITTLGTGAFVLSGNCMTGYRPFTFLTATNTCYYHCNNRLVNEWEVGLGTYTAGQLTRDVVLSSSNFNNKVNFTAGTKDLSLVVPSEAINGLLTDYDALDRTLVWSHEVTDVNDVYPVATGLDINTHEGYKLVCCLVSNTTADTVVALLFNDVPTATSSMRYVLSAGSTTSTNVMTTGFWCASIGTPVGSTSFSVADINLCEEFVSANVSMQRQDLTNVLLIGGRSSNVYNNITKITFNYTNASVGVGSKFYLFKKSNT